MRHSFSFPTHIRDAVRAHVRRAIDRIDPKRFHQEDPYTAALLISLDGVAYEGEDGFVGFKGTIVNSKGTNAAEHWAGADFAITADIRKGDFHVTKAILAQAKRGGLDGLSTAERGRLVGQIREMRRLTRSPKVLLIREIDGRREPEVASGVRISEELATRPMGLPDYFVRRVLTTLDGDTRPEFVEAVQESSLARLRVLANVPRSQ